MLLKKDAVLAAMAAGFALMLSACGGGGGGSSAPPTIYWPFTKINGDVCSNVNNPKPGCTYNRADGTRVSVTQAQDFNKYGHGSDDLWYVKFDSLGNAYIYDPKYSSIVPYEVVAADTLPGFKDYGIGSVWFGNDAGSYSYRHDVAGGTYWVDQNWVLYNANVGESTFMKAINNNGSDDASDMDFTGQNTEATKSAQDEMAGILHDKFGVGISQAKSVASISLAFGSGALERGYLSKVESENMFQKAFGVGTKDLQTAALESYSKQKASSSAIATFSIVANKLGQTKASQAGNLMAYLFKDAAKAYGVSDEQLSWVDTNQLDKK